MSARPTNEVSFVAFSPSAFHSQVHWRSHRRGSHDPNTQTEYLGRYLDALGAEGLVVEHHYVDRHFVEEYGAYYARGLVQRSNACARIHAFSEAWTEEGFERLCGAEDYEAARKRLDESYLGYVVVRPVPSVPIGRTVLRPLDDDPNRYLKSVVSYPVHLMGFRLEVEGLAFQQQDRAVAACATTATWTTLQRARRREGARCPSPFEITEAATRNVLEGRPYPSQGLDVLQITDAFRHFNFPPDVLRAQPDPALFWMLLHAYLRSRIPAVLGLPAVAGQPVGHAVAVVGYRKSEPLFSHRLAGGVLLHNAAFDQVYLHDDRLGPYARAGTAVEQHDVGWGPEAYPALHLEWPGKEVREIITEVRPVQVAVVPLYPKLRSSARELWTSALRLLPFVQAYTRGTPHEVGLEFFSSRSGTYTRRMHRKDIEPARLFRFLQQIALSRYVGVTRYYVDGHPFMDGLWDTTDTVREETRYDEHLLALVALQPAAIPLVDTLAEEFSALAG